MDRKNLTIILEEIVEKWPKEKPKYKKLGQKVIKALENG